jgi:hypothetical protein
MTIQIVDRNDLPEDYTEMMKTEQHHQHEIVRDSKGKLRWKEDPFTRRLVDACGIGYMIAGFEDKGLNKNSEIIRELYRRMGYPIEGYWELFYCELNNPNANL